MALATLSVDLVAKLASFEGDLKRAASAADRMGSDMNRAFGLAKAGLAGLVGALSVQQFTQFFRATVDGVDKLNDLRDATGATVENLSALENIGARTGTGIDTVSDAVVKLNKALGEAKPGSDAEAVFRSIGLGAAELRKLDPADALLKVAKALDTYADDGEKARRIQELFGKGAKELAPFLHDLADAGQLNATVTTEQAKAAEALNQQFMRMSKNSEDAARRIVGDFVPALNEILKTFTDKGLSAALNKFGNIAFDWENNATRKQIKMMDADLADLQKRASVIDSGVLDKIKTLGAGGTIGAAFTDTKEGLTSQIIELQRKREALVGALIDAQSPGARTGVGGDPNKKSVGAIPAKADAGRVADAERVARLIAEAEEQSAKESAEAWKAWEAQQLQDHKETTEAWAAQWKQVFDEIDAEQERAIEAGQAFLEKSVEQASEFAKEAARNVQDLLGESLYRSAKGGFSGILELWTDTLLRMASQAAAANLGKWLFGDDFAKSGSFGGGALGGLFKAIGFGADGSHAAGLDYVPWDGYRAILHRGEQVVPAAQARSQASAAAPTIVVQGDVGPRALRAMSVALAQFQADAMYQSRYR